MINFDHNKITEARWKKGLTRKALAQKLKMAESTVGAIERGLSNSPYSIKRIADFLDLTMDELLKKTKTKKEA